MEVNYPFMKGGHFAVGPQQHRSSQYAGIEFTNVSGQWQARPTARKNKKHENFDQIHSNNTSKWSGTLASTSGNINYFSEGGAVSLKNVISLAVEWWKACCELYLCCMHILIQHTANYGHDGGSLAAFRLLLSTFGAEDYR